MRKLRKEARTALEPLRVALHAAARAEANEVEAQAVDEAEAILAGAHSRAEDIIANAAAQGASVARASAARRSARVRREAHELVLAEQEALRQELADQVVQAIHELRSEPRYTAWVESLTQRCHEALGPLAVVTPSPSGGVVGQLGSSRLDLSVPVLAAAAVEAHGPEVKQLWMS